MNAVERKRHIVELLEKKESVEVAELTRLFSVSKVTARSDLDDLESRGLLVRTHGGAVAAERRDLVRLISHTINEHSDKKKKIGALAAALVKPGQNIIVDSGSTTIHLAQHIAGMPLTVITNSLLVIQRLMNAEQTELIIAGGVLRRQSMAIMGAAARRGFEQLHADLLFLGAAGFSLGQGITCSNLIEADTKQAMIRSASKVCLLVDSTKLERLALAKICDWDSIDILITDKIDTAAQAQLEALGVQVIDD